MRRKILLAVAVCLCFGCVKSKEYRQLADMGGQIGEAIYTNGAVAGGQLAKDNLTVHKRHIAKIGLPDSPIPYTPANLAQADKDVQAQDEVKEGIAGFLKGIGLTALNSVGLGWAVPPFVGLMAMFRRKQKKLVEIKTAAMAGVRTVNKVSDLIDGIKNINSVDEIRRILIGGDPQTLNAIKSIAKDSQEALGIRTVVRDLVKEFEKGKG